MPDDDSRDSYIQVRVSDSEKESIRDRADDLGLSMSEFVRRMALDGEVTIEEVPAINRKTWESLRGALSNLNQMARHANEGRVVEIDPEDFEELYDLIGSIREELVNP